MGNWTRICKTHLRTAWRQRASDQQYHIHLLLLHTSIFRAGRLRGTDMKITTSNSQLALTLLCCSIAATLASGQTLPSAINTPFAGAVISDFNGNVGVQLPNQPLAAPMRGDTLPAETVITTEGGRMLLRLQDGSEVLLRPHTRVVVKQPGATDWRYLQLLIGRIRTEVQKRFGGSTSFQVGTPSAVIS